MSCRILVILHSDHSRGFTSKLILARYNKPATQAAKVLHWLRKSLFENQSKNPLKGRGKVKHENFFVNDQRRSSEQWY